MKTIFTMVLICLANLSYSFIKFENVPLTALPSGIHYLGQPVQAMRYEDETGRYLALTSKSALEPQAEGEHLQARIHIYVYKYNDANTPVNLWQLHDRLVDCNGDAAGFSPEDFRITDLDKNGKAELWLSYRLNCHNSDQPGTYKMMMLNGTTRYSRRGVDAGPSLEKARGGKITSDSFTKAPAVFERHANLLWTGKEIVTR